MFAHPMGLNAIEAQVMKFGFIVMNLMEDYLIMIEGNGRYPSTKFKIDSSTRETMATFFWNCRGVILCV